MRLRLCGVCGGLGVRVRVRWCSPELGWAQAHFGGFEKCSLEQCQFSRSNNLYVTPHSATVGVRRVWHSAIYAVPFYGVLCCAVLCCVAYRLLETRKPNESFPEYNAKSDAASSLPSSALLCSALLCSALPLAGCG